MEPIVIGTDTRSRQTRRTIENAIAYFNQHVPGRVAGKAEALRKIEKAKQPMREAKRQIDALLMKTVDAIDDTPDFSDVQELMVRIINRDGVLDTPQRNMLYKLDRSIALGQLTRDQFNERAAVILALPCAVPQSLRRQHPKPVRPYTRPRYLRLMDGLLWDNATNRPAEAA